MSFESKIHEKNEKVNLANPLSREVLNELSKQDTLKGVGFILLDVVLIASAIMLTEEYFHPLLYVLAIMFIGNRQHSLLIQMHDAAHKNVSKNSFINDTIGEVICAWPMFITMKAYREHHNKHHRFSNTEKDPDFIPERYPKSRKEIYKMLLMDVTGLNTILQLKEIGKFKTELHPKVKMARRAFYIAMFSSIIYFGAVELFLMYWMVPLFTWLKMVLRLRAIADHSGPGLSTNLHPFDTRTVIPNLFDRVFIAPRYCSYHLVHHTYGNIPSHRLKEGHEELMKIKEFKDRARITNGFINLFREFPATENSIDKNEFQHGFLSTVRVLPQKTISDIQNAG